MISYYSFCQLAGHLLCVEVFRTWYIKYFLIIHIQYNIYFNICMLKAICIFLTIIMKFYKLPEILVRFDEYIRGEKLLWNDLVKRGYTFLLM